MRQRQCQQVGYDGRLAVWRTANHFHQIHAALTQPSGPHATLCVDTTEELGGLASRNAQREASRREVADRRLKPIPLPSRYEISVWAVFRNPSAKLHFALSGKERDGARAAPARRRIAE